MQNERIRMEMDQTRKRQCRSILTAIRGRALHALMEKEAELESISRRNAELEEKVSQLASDNQVWIHVARSNEAAVSSLRAMLEQALAEGALAPPTALQDQEEGFGETDFPAPAVMSTDAYSFCYKETLVADAKESSKELCRRSVCKVCLEREVSVLMLPCRHLCLCKQCDVAVDTCPICCSIKNASLQVFMA
ncbi:unnamed protein product [Spirodela intermedia]|uniref:RING-type domain-containing protein n=1 Tax=Spirodela intermedia TaxID=51605 RepID=A0A7I8KS86_SPIIN|nr:unnamed protein product [Spirodela intermedia]